MRAALIVNPHASSFTPRATVLIQRAITERHQLTVHETQRRGHATRLARAACDEGAEVVFVLGGDGTLNEVANGLVETDIALAALPGGSTNVFARTVGITNDALDATGELLDAIDAGKFKRIGLGRANNRYFLFHAGIGFDAAVIETVEQRSSLKRYAGHPLFVWSTLLTLAKQGERRSPRFSVRFDDPRHGQRSVDGYLTIAMNSNPYTFLGNMALNVAPGLDFDTAMTIVTVKSLRFPNLTNIIAASLFSGKRLRRNPRADFRQDVGRFEVVGYGKFPYQLDGDYLGDVDSLEVTHVPDVLNVVFPAATATR